MTSPVSGIVIANRTTGDDFAYKYLIIRDMATGYHHVIGQLESDLAKDTAVQMGKPIGRVVPTGNSTHIHWGVNIISVDRAIGEEWTWSHAPHDVTEAHVFQKGWINPMNLLKKSQNKPSL